MSVAGTFRSAFAASFEKNDGECAWFAAAGTTPAEGWPAGWFAPGCTPPAGTTPPFGVTADAGFIVSCGGGSTPGCVTSGFFAAVLVASGVRHPLPSDSRPAATAINA